MHQEIWTLSAKEITKLEMSSWSSFKWATGSSPSFASIISTNFAEYNITPNLIGRLFSNKEMIMSIVCNIQIDYRGIRDQYEAHAENSRWPQRTENLPQFHEEMQDPEHKLHGTGFYECNVIVQGRLASKSINRDGKTM